MGWGPLLDVTGSSFGVFQWSVQDLAALLPAVAILYMFVAARLVLAVLLCSVQVGSGIADMHMDARVCMIVPICDSFCLQLLVYKLHQRLVLAAHCTH